MKAYYTQILIFFLFERNLLFQHIFMNYILLLLSSFCCEKYEFLDTFPIISFDCLHVNFFILNSTMYCYYSRRYWLKYLYYKKEFSEFEKLKRLLCCVKIIRNVYKNDGCVLCYKFGGQDNCFNGVPIHTNGSTLV